MKQNLRISQCMIVKNEEANIEKALSWGKNIMWEQIVADTGSLDRTLELAERAGAAVYRYAWVDDFSAAKNFALEQAKGDWIAFLDADEYLSSDTAEKLPLILEECDRLGVDAVTASMVNVNEDGSTWGAGTLVRFFRNDPKLRYHRRIHEQLRLEEGRVMKIRDASNELTIFHTGYSGQAYQNKKKDKRNIRLIEHELCDRPDSYEMMGYLGDEYYSEEEWEQAIHWYGRAIEQMPEQLPVPDQRSAVTFAKLMDSLMRLKQADYVLPYYEKAVELFPEEADYDYLAGRFFIEEEEYSRAEYHIQLALDKLNHFGFNGRSMIVMANLEDLYVNLAESQYRQNKRKETVQTATALLKEQPYQMKMLFILLKCFREEQIAVSEKMAYAGQVCDFLQTIYNCSLSKDRLFIWKTACQAGYRELAVLIEQMMKEEERQVLK